MPSEEERHSMSPGRPLSVAEVEAIDKIKAKLRAVRAAEAADDRGCYEPPTPLGVKVDRVVRQNSDLKSLCGEILATFTLPQNREFVGKLGPQFPDILASWRRRFDKCGGEA